MSTTDTNGLKYLFYLSVTNITIFDADVYNTLLLDTDFFALKTTFHMHLFKIVLYLL